MSFLRFVLVVLTFGASCGLLRAQSEVQKELDDNFKQAQALGAKKQWKEALPFSQRAAELAPEAFGPDHPNTGAVINRLGINLSWLDRHKEAEKAYRDGLAIREKHAKERPLPVAESLGNLVGCMIDQKRFAEAEKLLQRCLEIEDAALPAKSPLRHARLGELVFLYERMRRPAEGESAGRKCLKVQEEMLGADHPALVKTLAALTDFCIATRKRKDAEAFARRAIRLLDRAEQPTRNDDLTLARLCGSLSKIAGWNGNTEEADALLRRCLALREKRLGKAHPLVASTMYDLSQRLADQNRDAEAGDLLHRCLKIQEGTLGPKHPEVADTLFALGCWKERLGLFDEAEALLGRAIDTFDAALGQGNLDAAPALQVLGRVQSEKRQYDEAEKSLRRALALYEQRPGSASHRIGATLNELAIALSRTGREAEGEALQRRSVEIARRDLGPRHPATSMFEHNLAHFYERAGKFAEAEELLQICLKNAALGGGKYHHSFGAVHASLATVALAQGKLPLAIERQQRLLEFEQQRCRNVFEFASEATMLAFLDTLKNELPTLLSMALKDPEGPAAEAACAWTLCSQGIVFETICRYHQARSSSIDPAFKKQLDEYVALRQRISTSALNSNDEAAAPTGEGIKEWRTQLDRLEGELNKEISRRTPVNPSSVAAGDVRSALPPKSAMILFVEFPRRDFKANRWDPRRLAAFVLTPGQKSVRLVDLGEAKDVNQGVVALRKELEDFQDKLRECETAKEMLDLEKSQEPLFRKQAATLYEKLLGPLEGGVGDAELLYLVTDGALNRLPFESLVDAGGKYLAESRRCVYLSTGRDVLRPEPKLARGTVVFAGPDFKASRADRQAVTDRLLPKSELVAARGGRRLDVRSAGWTPLPGAAAEAGDIRDVLTGSPFGPVKTHTGTDAMEEVLKSLSAPRILHLATHGFYLDHQKSAEAVEPGAGAGWARGRLKTQDNPLLRSGIVLAGANTIGDKDEPTTGDDGWVTAEEIALLNLQGTELVVLSACQTGLGDVRTGEGVFGLRRAFLYAGARSLLTSLFEVPDAETRDLMQRFYQGLKAGQTKSAALNSAQRAIIDRRRQGGGVAHPFYWASFVLVGDPK